MSSTIETFVKNWFEDGNQQLSLYKSDDSFFQFFYDYKELSDDECRNFIKQYTREDNGFFENIILVLSYFRVGKVNLYKKEIKVIFESLLKSKRYTRIIQLTKVIELLNIPKFENLKYLETVKLRTGDIRTESLDYDFNSIIDNANIYFQNKDLRREFFKCAEVYPLHKILGAFLVGLSEISQADDLLDEVVILAQESNSFKLKELLLEVYPKLERELKSIKSEVEYETKLEAIDERRSSEQINYGPRGSCNDILVELASARESLYEDGITSEIYFMLVDKIANKYLQLGETKKYESLQNRIRDRKIKSQWSDIK